MQRVRTLALFIVLSGLAHISMETPAKSADFSRYPYWLPEWLWNGGAISRLLDDPDRSDLLKSIDAINKLPQDSNDSWKLTESVTTTIARKFAGRDLQVGADIVSDPASGRQLFVHLDPTFSATMKPVLLKAVSLFLSIATDQTVIENALNRADDHPEPFPPKDIEENGKVSSNPLYRNYLQSIVRPTGTASFARTMSAALTRSDGNVPILVIARYDGNPWWGGSYYDYHDATSPKLKRLTPQGFFYVRLNSEKMQEGQLRFDDPAFWASKISHEILHNLGYWHPNYADPDERDRYTRTTAPFIVGYEAAILAALDASRSNGSSRSRDK